MCVKIHVWIYISTLDSNLTPRDWFLMSLFPYLELLSPKVTNSYSPQSICSIIVYTKSSFRISNLFSCKEKIYQLKYNFVYNSFVISLHSFFRCGGSPRSCHVRMGSRASTSLWREELDEDQDGDLLLPQSNHLPLQPVHQPGQKWEWDPQLGRFPVDSRSCHQATWGLAHQWLLSRGKRSGRPPWLHKIFGSLLTHWR